MVSRGSAVQEAIAYYENKDTQYGVRDCCQFAGRVYQTITNRNPLEEFDYNSIEEAYAEIESRGGWEKMLNDVLGPSSDSLDKGDPVLVRIPGMGLGMGVMFNGLPVILTERRFIQAPLSTIVKGWSI